MAQSLYDLPNHPGVRSFFRRPEVRIAFVGFGVATLVALVLRSQALASWAIVGCLAVLVLSLLIRLFTDVVRASRRR